MEKRPEKPHNRLTMTNYHPTGFAAPLLITMGRAESHDPPSLS